jgi:hypothetical protein
VAATCVHELDVVILRTDLEGRGPEGEAVSLPAGTEGTVIVDRFTSGVYDVEVVDPDTGAARAFVKVRGDQVDVAHRYQPAGG